MPTITPLGLGDAAPEAGQRSDEFPAGDAWARSCPDADNRIRGEVFELPTRQNRIDFPERWFSQRTHNRRRGRVT